MAMHKLTVREIAKIDAPGLYGDGGTLYLKVRDNGEGGRGSAQWIQIMHIEGKRYERGLGGYPVVPLEHARQVAFANRRSAKLGDNPFVKPSVAKVAPTFADALEAVLENHRGAWTNHRTEVDWRNTLRDYAMPTLGSMAVDAIQTPNVLACLEPIWHVKRDTAEKVRRRIAMVMDWAIGKEYRADNPVAGVESVLPKARPTGRTHQKALPYCEVADAIATVRDSNTHLGIKLAFEFLVLTASRSKPVCRATFDEIDWEAKLWNVPANHMKGRAAHVVPLPERAMDLLAEASETYGDDDTIFPSPRGKTLHGNHLTTLLTKLGINAVPHGFRSSFRDWAAVHDWRDDIAEVALAHKERNAVKAAYKRTDYKDERREMMEQWADYCLPKD